MLTNSIQSLFVRETFSFCLISQPILLGHSELNTCIKNKQLLHNNDFSFGTVLLEVYRLDALEPNKLRNFLWFADSNVTATLHLVNPFISMGADAKLNQHGPLGVAYHRRHPISTVPVARITAHATVPGYALTIY